MITSICYFSSKESLGQVSVQAARDRGWRLVIHDVPFGFPYEKGQMAADADHVANIDRLNYRNVPLTDSAGRVSRAATTTGTSRVPKRCVR